MKATYFSNRDGGSILYINWRTDSAKDYAKAYMAHVELTKLGYACGAEEEDCFAMCHRNNTIAEMREDWSYIKEIMKEKAEAEKAANEVSA